MRRWFLFPVVFLALGAEAVAECSAVTKEAETWRAIDRQYSVIEQSTLAKDAAALFSVYSPDFEAHNIDGSVWKFRDSADYSTAGFNQVKQNIRLTNTIVALISCVPGEVRATVLQQWTRMQESFGQLRRYETNTVQDETWALIAGEWKRKMVDDIRPGAWYIDGKRVDPTIPYDPAAPEFDPRVASGSKSEKLSSKSEK